MYDYDLGKDHDMTHKAVKVESRQLRQQNKMSTFLQNTGSFKSVHFRWETEM